VDVPASINPDVPSIARTYDYLLGGTHNFPADREIGDIFVNKFPGAVEIAVDNRRCMARAVDVMVREFGIDQFLDLGSGLPTAENVHQVAQRVNPAARVFYVDIDPIVLAHGRELLAGNELATLIQADIREPARILSDPELRALIDFSRPVGVIASAVLHHIEDAEDPGGIIRTFRDAVPAGSFLFVSHFRSLGDPGSAALEDVMREAFGRGMWRTDAQIAEYLTGTALVEPGIVPCALWRPTADPGQLSGFQQLIAAGLGGK
jgi:hypothetical protein